MTDPLKTLVMFAEKLRSNGIVVSADRISIAAEALGHWHAAGGTDLYWPLRAAFCTSEADLLRFDAAYRAWTSQVSPGDAGSSPEIPVPSRSRGDGTATDAAADDADGGADTTAKLATRDFEDLTEDELREVSDWTDLLETAPVRRTMQPRPARSGRIDAARTSRLVLRNGGELLRIRHRRHAIRRRRLLLIVDVSASMHPYGDVLLRFAHAALRANPRTTEVLAVGTHHADLTKPLSSRYAEMAFIAAGRVATGWSSGTTLGVALRDFLRFKGGSSTVRSAIVVLGSDGFESGDPALMIAQIARLASLARTFIWVDPAKLTDDYRPVDDRIALAQSYATTVLGCHSYEALCALAKVITNA